VLTRRKIASTAAMALASALVLAGCAGSPGSGSETGPGAEKIAALRVGIDISYPPFEFMDKGEPGGIDVEVAKALGDELGVPVKIENIGFDSLISSLQGGRVDVIISAMKDSKERHQRLNLIDYFKTGESLLVKRGNPKGITDLASLCGLKVGQVSGTVTLTALEKASKKCQDKPIEVLPFGSNADVNVALKSDRIDANLEDDASLRYVAKTSGDGRDFEVIPQKSRGDTHFGIGTLKNDTEKTEAIRTAYSQVLNSGKLSEIYKKWDTPMRFPPV